MLSWELKIPTLNMYKEVLVPDRRQAAKKGLTQEGHASGCRAHPEGTPCEAGYGRRCSLQTCLSLTGTQEGRQNHMEGSGWGKMGA